MWPSRQAEKNMIAASLLHHALCTRPLPGILDGRAVETLALQFVASIRREKYFELVQAKQISPSRADPNSAHFDAERAIAYHMQQNNVNEAAWLVFLMTYFAKPKPTGWLRLRDIYGKQGAGIWDWQSVSANPAAFVGWLTANWQGIRGKFGNHRKYESLRPNAQRSMARVVTDYTTWIGPNGHQQFFSDIVRRSGNDPTVIFDTLYSEMNVVSFGRLAKFDYLSMIGRYRIAPIFAGSAYLDGATGPAKGARLLFDGDREGTTSTHDLQLFLNALDTDLQVGMQVIEDALCNWQKQPFVFEHFKG